MAPTQDILLENWNDIKDLVQQRWAKLTVNDLARLSEKTEEFVFILRLRYGYGKAQAELEIDNWLRSLAKE